ncbi:2-oxo-4-hydroxy-4-carboxy-5-ureidoimidazoline decarboxylase [Nocardia sp. 2]|uniref:2-oxo-4-hydroxy-4-carboxy-5-ureidoimidazoline decarboxylase n=1 Tax=Nocardia acididurans TaxID=2802282 RepID=A0ABS1M561_9NOCA|nr:2-oxo-4-hydroxy-4-carboxy-5-ureidoimidazoline decarboxylase [Nocardia acididurans]MBL1075797.1 2-oxo-4-hydroxy-4-carboxy-5-ureidoimidazoline decarboxylase [Nocardia acididurans]
MTQTEIGLTAFDALPESAAVETLLSCCSSPAWAAGVAARRPYADLESLLSAADAVLEALTEAEIDRALAGHPRIGERPDSANSAREQAGMATADDVVRAAIADGNRVYEQRFGHVYLVCATGRTPAELLSILESRLGNAAADERRIVRRELVQINRIRLRRMIGEEGAS